MSHNSPKTSVCHQNPISVIYSPIPHSDVVIKHSRIHDNSPRNADGEQHCWSNQDWQWDNTSQTGTSPLRTIQCILQCILHTCFKMINKSWWTSKGTFCLMQEPQVALIWTAGKQTIAFRFKNTMRPFLAMQKDERSKWVVKSKL